MTRCATFRAVPSLPRRGAAWPATFFPDPDAIRRAVAPEVRRLRLAAMGIAGAVRAVAAGGEPHPSPAAREAQDRRDWSDTARVRRSIEHARGSPLASIHLRMPEEQLLFAFEEIEATLAENAAVAGKASAALRDNQAKRRRAGRGRLPAHLPRVEVVLAPEATVCPCCQGPLVEIGVDAAERLDVIPAQFRVVVTKRPKLACRARTGVVVQAPAPARLIEGGVPTEATVAHVLVSRYADHLPLYRQAQILARQGIEIGRELLADWTGAAASEVMPVVRRMREILLGSPRLFADETTMPVLDPGRGRTKKGYAWAIARDDRPWGGTDPPAVVFHYAPGRGSPTAEAIRYVLNHRDGLVRFLDEGRIELDTNTVERAIRPICLSRKNALFASGDDGGTRWAAVASLVETCKLNGVDPQRYFADVLTRLVNDWPNSRIDELMPWHWAASRRN